MLYNIYNSMNVIHLSNTFKSKFNFITGTIGKGFPPFQPPPFSTNGTNGTIITFGEMIQELNTSIITIALISILEAVAIAKAFCNLMIL